MLLLMVVVARRFVRRSRKVVRCITLMVHHIQAAHSDGARRSVRSSGMREARSLLPVHTGCTPGAVGASIYAQTHTMAMPSDNEPPAAPPTPRATEWIGTLCDKVYPKKKKLEEKNISDRSSGASDGVLIAFSRLSVFFGGELYLDRAGALYARPPGKGLQERWCSTRHRRQPPIWACVAGSHS